MGLLLLLASGAQAQITHAERRGLDNALYIANLTEKDLGYEKKISDDPYRMVYNQTALDDPLAAADALIEWHQAANGTLAQLLQNACTYGFADQPPKTDPTMAIGTIPPEIPEPLREPIRTLAGEIFQANLSVHNALQHLSLKERRDLIESLPQWANPSSKYSFVKEPVMPPSQILALLSKVDLVQIRQAGIVLSQQIESQLPAWRALADQVQLKGCYRFAINGLRIEIAGQSDEVHTSRDTNLCIDLGGSNTFTGRFGAGVGYASVLMAFGDHNRYVTPDVGIGAGLLGVGLAYDLGKASNFSGQSLCFGSGIAGVGALYSEAPQAAFHAVSQTEGYGFFGVGLLKTIGNECSYNGQLFCQGAARTQGVGWLATTGSDNSFKAGGLVKIPGRNTTLSASQGYSAGFQTAEGLLSGGIGMLTDLGGGNLYNGEVRCQAAAQWGGIGTLYDEGGHGSRVAVQESQGFANHEAAAYLFDMGGASSFVARERSSDACAGDYSVAFLLDRGGHNVYAGKDTRIASGSSNGLAIFLSSGGENTYAHRPASAAPARGAGSVGIFCDLGSNSDYNEPISLGPARVDGAWSVFYAAPTTAPEIAESPGRPQEIKHKQLPNPGDPKIADLWRVARSGGQPGVEARDTLAAIGAPAVSFLIKTHLLDDDVDAGRLLAFVVRGAGDDGVRMLVQEISGADPVRVRAALRLACAAPGPGLDDAIDSALKIPGCQRLAARAAGLCHADKIVNDLLPLTISPDSVLALEALVSLDEIGSASSAGTAAAMIGSPQLLIRIVAIDLLAKFPKDATAEANSLLATQDEPKQRLAIDLLAAVGTPAALDRISGVLPNAAPGVAIEVMLALQGRVPDAMKPAFSDLCSNPNPLVRVIAQGIRVDR